MVSRRDLLQVLAEAYVEHHLVPSFGRTLRRPQRGEPAFHRDEARKDSRVARVADSKPGRRPGLRWARGEDIARDRVGCHHHLVRVHKEQLVARRRPERPPAALRGDASRAARFLGEGPNQDIVRTSQVRPTCTRSSDRPARTSAWPSRLRTEKHRGRARLQTRNGVALHGQDHQVIRAAGPSLKKRKVLPTGVPRHGCLEVRAFGQTCCFAGAVGVHPIQVGAFGLVAIGAEYDALAVGRPYRIGVVSGVECELGSVVRGQVVDPDVLLDGVEDMDGQALAIRRDVRVAPVQLLRGEGRSRISVSQSRDGPWRSGPARTAASRWPTTRAALRRRFVATSSRAGTAGPRPPADRDRKARRTRWPDLDRSGDR